MRLTAGDREEEEDQSYSRSEGKYYFSSYSKKSAIEELESNFENPIYVKLTISQYVSIHIGGLLSVATFEQ